MKPAELRRQSIEWAKQMVSDPWNLFIDTETTGLDGNAEICDIAVVNLRGEILLNTLVKPTCPIPAGATKIHGIGDEHVKDAPPWREVWYHLASLIRAGRQIVVYNEEYDHRVINQCCERARVPSFKIEPRWHCAMLKFAAFDGTPGNFGTPKWWKLPIACEKLGIEFVETHRALADAAACRRIVMEMAGVKA